MNSHCIDERTRESEGEKREREKRENFSFKKGNNLFCSQKGNKSKTKNGSSLRSTRVKGGSVVTANRTASAESTALSGLLQDGGIQSP